LSLLVENGRAHCIPLRERALAYCRTLVASGRQAGQWAAVRDPQFDAQGPRDADPTLILDGDRDRAAARGARSFLAAARRGELRTIPNAGYACSLDQPDAFNQAVRESASWLGARR
jgi:pimeloyl-ACP methyl ester carboxylesterase